VTQQDEQLLAASVSDYDSNYFFDRGIARLSQFEGPAVRHLKIDRSMRPADPRPVFSLGSYFCELRHSFASSFISSTATRT
jgi:hypothetical protein